MQHPNYMIYYVDSPEQSAEFYASLFQAQAMHESEKFFTDQIRLRHVTRFLRQQPS